MNKFQRRVIKIAKIYQGIRPDLPVRETIKDARTTVKDIIKHLNPIFLREKW